MNEADYSSATIISRLISSISSDKFKETSDVLTAWNQTLSSIKSFQKDEAKPVEYGSQLADHSRIIDLQNEILIVETDHPGRIQMFQLYKRYILNGLKQKIPGIPIKNIVFKLRKPESASGRLRMPTSAEFENAAVLQEKQISSSTAISGKTQAVPQVRAANAADKAADAASFPLKDTSSSFSEDASNNCDPLKTGAPLPPELQALFSSMKENLSK